MKRVLPAVAILAFLILPQAAQAQYFDQDQLAKVEKIFVEVIDGVSDGCLPSPNVLKVEAELILRRSGITAADGLRGGAYQLAIVANGFALSRLPSTLTSRPDDPLTDAQVAPLEVQIATLCTSAARAGRM